MRTRQDQDPPSGTTRITIRAEFAVSAPGFYSFIGPVAYYSLRHQNFACEYFCDGMLASWVFSTIFRRSVRRTSFDYSSIAKRFFEDCEGHDRRILVVGGTFADAAAFGEHLRSTYPQLRFHCQDGYPIGGFQASRFEAIATQASGFDVVLLALGSPLQERVGQHLVERGFQGTVITAGAFVTQTVSAGARPYYPKLVNALNLRFLWRLIHEPHTRSRFKYVFMFPLSFLADLLRGNVRVKCI